MSAGANSGHLEVLDAIAAITGQNLADTEADFRDAKAHSAAPDLGLAGHEDTAQFVARVKSRVGLAPALDTAERKRLQHKLDHLIANDALQVTRHGLEALDQLLRHTPEHVPTLDRSPVTFPDPLPPHLAAMWKTLLAFEKLEQPWSLVGGQMTTLHCLENGFPQQRATDDGDIVVGVWTRRDALRRTSRFLVEHGFRELSTSDGYGYRHVRDEDPNLVIIDVIVPEGLERQKERPTTASGRHGLGLPGANQALSRTERVPLTVDAGSGHVRRPNLLGAIVVKAHAYVADSRDKERHGQDIAVLAEIALQDPQSVLEGIRNGDRSPIKRFLRDKRADHAFFRGSAERDAVFALLTRMAEDP